MQFAIKIEQFQFEKVFKKYKINVVFLQNLYLRITISRLIREQSVSATIMARCLIGDKLLSGPMMTCVHIAHTCMCVERKQIQNENS